VGFSQSSVRSSRAIQLPLIVPQPTSSAGVLETRGVVYTRRWVVDLLLDLAGYTPQRDLVGLVAVEPAAGDGAFLVPMVERLIESCRRHGRQLAACSSSIVAYELNETSARAARDVVSTCLAKCGVNPELAASLAASWVRTGDYLLEAHAISADFVIGNPPYVRLEDIPEETAAFYRNSYPTMIGRADLYVAFFEAALRQLRQDGVCAFICADRWMRNQYGAELRELVTSGYAVDVVIDMHDANAFHDEVDAYPAITIIRRAEQGPVLVACASPAAEKHSTGEITAALQAAVRGADATIPEVLSVAKVESWFQGASPWPCQSPGQLALLRFLEERFEPLDASARVGIGVATGNDSLFITKDPHLVEPSRLLKLALVEDIAAGTLRWSGHFLVDPWNCDGLVDLSKYPRLKQYFEDHASELKRRHTAVKNSRGWYRTIDRVTHALTEKPKLYIADIKNSLEPVLDRGETYPHHNLYFIQSDEWDLEVLGGLLISALGQFFVESYGIRMRGGYFRFQAQYLRRIRVPSPGALTSTQRRQLREAFQARDKQLASDLALQVYGLTVGQMEKALGH
jgi:adenine-specific DNA-methyltransferase